MRRIGLTIALVLATASAAAANTYTVTTTANSGAGSLRQAILDANANAGADTIAFNITGSGVHTILIESFLPAITSPVTIDGYTQPGTSANTLPVGQGLNTSLKIELSAEGLFFPAGGCVQVQASDTTIRGLAITHCDIGNASGIVISNAPTNVRIEGNFLGVAPDGVTRTDQGFAKQVLVATGTNIVVGGVTPASRNQMAVFLLKAKHGSTYDPPNCNGDFADVACPGNPFADWIEQLAAENITGGCGGPNYCPTQSVRRDQMAAFLFNTFQFP